MFKIGEWLMFATLMFFGGTFMMLLDERVEAPVYFRGDPSDTTWVNFIFLQLIAGAFMLFRKSRAGGVALCAISLPNLWHLIDKPLIQDRMIRLKIKLMLDSLGWHPF